MSVTLKQIANEAGVSQPLVTRALSGKPGVADATRQRIFEVATQLRYDPQANRVARAMAAQRHGTKIRTGVLALLINEAALSSSHAAEPDNPFFLPFFNGVELEANNRGYDVFVGTWRAAGLPRLVRSHSVDGVIALSVPAAHGELSELPMPVVSFGTSKPAALNLAVDHEGGVRQAMEYLFEKGHRRIAFFGVERPEISLIVRQRFAAYRKTLGTLKLARDEKLEEIVFDVQDRDGGAQAVEKLLKRKTDFSAVVCSNDWVAMGAIEYLQTSRYRVPDDVAVVGFDDVTPHLGFRPQITSIAYDRLAMGRRAVEMLCEYFDGQEKPSDELVPVQLMQRETA